MSCRACELLQDRLNTGLLGITMASGIVHLVVPLDARTTSLMEVLTTVERGFLYPFFTNKMRDVASLTSVVWFCLK